MKKLFVLLLCVFALNSYSQTKLPGQFITSTLYFAPSNSVYSNFVWTGTAYSNSTLQNYFVNDTTSNRLEYFEGGALVATNATWTNVWVGTNGIFRGTSYWAQVASRNTSAPGFNNSQSLSTNLPGFIGGGGIRSTNPPKITATFYRVDYIMTNNWGSSQWTNFVGQYNAVWLVTNGMGYNEADQLYTNTLGAYILQPVGLGLNPPFTLNTNFIYSFALNTTGYLTNFPAPYTNINGSWNLWFTNVAGDVYFTNAVVGRTTNFVYKLAALDGDWLIDHITNDTAQTSDIFVGSPVPLITGETNITWIYDTFNGYSGNVSNALAVGFYSIASTTTNVSTNFFNLNAIAPALSFVNRVDPLKSLLYSDVNFTNWYVSGDNTLIATGAVHSVIR